MMVLVLAKVSASNASNGPLSSDCRSPSMEHRQMSYRKLLLMAAAFVGLALVVLGQSDTSLSPFRAFPGNHSFGIVLALLSACATAALGVAGFVFGDRLCDHYHAKASDPHVFDGSADDRQPSPPNGQSDLQRLWFIFLLGTYIPD